MEVLGASVPVSYWTVASLAVGTAVSLLVWRPLSGRVGWRPPYTLLGLLAVTVTLSLTLPPGREEMQSGLRACLVGGAAAVRDIGATPGSVLNALLLVPVGFAIAAASRKAWPGVVVSFVLPVVIEAAQTMIPGRQCDPGDVSANVLGGLLGVLIAATFVRHRDQGARQGARH